MEQAKNSEIDNEFVITTPNEQKPTLQETVQRLNEFSYYLIVNVEEKLQYFLDILEEKPETKKPNSYPVQALALLSMAIPTVGRGISNGVKESENYVLKKIDKNNSRLLADLIYFFSDNGDNVRQIFIDTAINLFYCFEQQFMKLNCDGGPKRAMFKLAKDASQRIFSQFLEEKWDKPLTIEEVLRGIVFGNSPGSLGKKGRSVTSGEGKVWTTDKIYKKPGVFLEETGEYFITSESKPEKYGFRKQFPWENRLQLQETWSVYQPSNINLQFNLAKSKFPELSQEIREYVMQKSPLEAARLDREKRHDAIMGEQSIIQQDIIKKLEEFFKELQLRFESLQNQNANHEFNAERRHEKVDKKLDEIHEEVTVTKESQMEIKETTAQIRNDVQDVKNKQEECSSTVANLQQNVQQIGEATASISLGDLISNNYEVRRAEEGLKRLEKNIRREFKKLF